MADHPCQVTVGYSECGLISLDAFRRDREFLRVRNLLAGLAPAATDITLSDPCGATITQRWCTWTTDRDHAQRSIAGAVWDVRPVIRERVITLGRAAGTRPGSVPKRSARCRIALTALSAEGCHPTPVCGAPDAPIGAGRAPMVDRCSALRFCGRERRSGWVAETTRLRIEGGTGAVQPRAVQELRPGRNGGVSRSTKAGSWVRSPLGRIVSRRVRSSPVSVTSRAAAFCSR